MEGKDAINSTVQFQGSSVLPVQAQAEPWDKDLLYGTTIYNFPAMAASAQLPGTSKLFAENFVHRSHFLGIYNQIPIGYFSSCGFYPVSYDNKCVNSNEKAGMIGLDSWLLDEGRSISSLKNEIISVPGKSESVCHFDSHKQHKNLDVLEQLGAPPLAASKKRFILFDRSGNNGKVLFHTKAVCDFMAPIAEEPDRSGSSNKICHFQDYQASLKILEQNNVNSVAGMCSRHGETVASAFAPLDNMRISQLASQTISNMDNALQVVSQGTCADSVSHISCRDSSHREGTELSDSLHEDTQDLDALMSSDEDEKSTGHSPSDLTWNEMLTNNLDGNSVESYSVPSKRKICDYQCFNEYGYDVSCQEVESKLKENPSLQFLDLCCTNKENSENSSSLRMLEPVAGFRKSNVGSGVHMSSALQDDSNTKLCQEYSLHYGQSVPRKRMRKEKIKTTVKLLRSIIPGGNSMDTADVLGEAIQYVRTLQMKVSKLETTKRARI